MVEQLGLAMILSFLVNTSAFISGTTNFFVGSILHADELSITVIPASANLGAHSREVPPPAEKIATSGFAAIPSSMLTTLYFFPLNVTSFPTDLSEATGMISDTGKFLSANTWSIFEPTRPVAPTTATFIIFCSFTPLERFLMIKIIAPFRGQGNKNRPSILEGLQFFMVTYITLQTLRQECFFVRFVCVQFCITSSKNKTANCSVKI